MSKKLLLFCICSFLPLILKAQRPVFIRDNTEQHIFGYSEIEYLEDPKGSLSFDQVNSEQNVQNLYRVNILHRKIIIFNLPTGTG